MNKHTYAISKQNNTYRCLEVFVELINSMLNNLATQTTINSENKHRFKTSHTCILIII